MNCRQCLAELATGSLRDLQPESSVMQHCATCPDCGPLATMLRDREYNAATILNNLPPISNPIAVAETAAMVAQRRRVGKVVVFLTGAALIATVTTSLFLTQFGRAIVGVDRANLVTETIPLSCLSPEQAGDIVDPYFRTRGSLYYISRSGVPAITVRGTGEQVAKSKELIRAFDGDPRMCKRNPRAILGDLEKELRRIDADEPNPAPVVAPSVAAPSAPKK